ncbi:MAG: hypothetical protein OER96_13780 [Gammaproteobacteria bacterium]|nr:hypothetical protein [Gammaproteobacteria bacterium]
MDFSDAAQSYLDYLKENGKLSDYRITRRKLGLSPAHLAEFHIMLEFETLTQLDNAFTNVSSRADPVESFHHAVNSKVQDVSFALYRDFPDAHRVRGGEKF